MPEFGSPEFYSKLLVSALLVLLGSAFAGLVSPLLAFRPLIVFRLLASLLV